MHIFKEKISGLLWVLVLFVLATPAALAQEGGGGSGSGEGGSGSGGGEGGPGSGSTGTGADSGQFNIDNPLGPDADSLLELINRIITVLIQLAVPITVIMVVFAGFLYVTSAGNEERVAKAHKTIAFAAIGFGVLLLSKSVIVIVQDILTTGSSPVQQTTEQGDPLPGGGGGGGGGGGDSGNTTNGGTSGGGTTGNDNGTAQNTPISVGGMSVQPPAGEIIVGEGGVFRFTAQTNQPQGTDLIVEVSWGDNDGLNRPVRTDSQGTVSFEAFKQWETAGTYTITFIVGTTERPLKNITHTVTVRAP